MGSVCSPWGHKEPEESRLWAGEAPRSVEETDIYPLLCGARSTIEVCPDAGAHRGQGPELCEAEMMVEESMGPELRQHTGHLREGGKASVTSHVGGHLLGLWISTLAAH